MGHNHANRFQELHVFVNLFFRRAEQRLHSGVAEDARKFDEDVRANEKDVSAGDRIRQFALSHMT